MVTRYLLVACLIGIAIAEEVDSNEAFRAVAQSTNAFSSQLFQTVVEENPGNLIMSPLSAALVLGMVAYGARGETENQFRKVLHLPSPDSLGKSGYQALIDNTNNTKENTLTLANKVFMAENYSVKPSFRELTETYFRSTTQLVDFTKSDEAANIINTWVEGNTNNRINNLVSPGEMNGATLVLVNAVYFKGQWKHKFNANRTKDLPFYVNENTVQNVPTMQTVGSYKYGVLSNLNATFIEIPYRGDELSMVIIVPNEINGLPMVETKLQGMSIADILNQGYKREVILSLPKFKIEKKIDLKSVLGKMGLTDMFTARANFSGIAADHLRVSNVVQKAFIEVNEEGSEAAAATNMAFMYWSGPALLYFEINQPFWYAVTTKNASIILFSGRIINPALSSVETPHA